MAGKRKRGRTGKGGRRHIAGLGPPPNKKRKDEIVVEFGRLLKQARIDAGWTQAQVANLMYEAGKKDGSSNVVVNAAQVADWENGVRGPTLAMALLLQRVFGRDFSEALD